MSDARTVDELLKRARSQKGLGIKYKLGGGTIKAGGHTCADANNACDCSAFVCWALGIDKQGSYPYLVSPGQPSVQGDQWYGTDNIWNDTVHLAMGLFQKISGPAPGSLILFPTQRVSGGKSTSGHVGIVTKISPTAALTVLHCSSGHFKATKDSMQETDDTVFRGKSGLVYAWCSRIAVAPVSAARASGPDAVPSLTLSKPVLFCVLADGGDGDDIRKVGETVAQDNPFGRRVVVRGGAGFPSGEDIEQWTAGIPTPGAAVLTPSGSLFKVLTVSQAKSELVVDKAFADAGSANSD
jgi:hypothetical protein